MWLLGQIIKLKQDCELDHAEDPFAGADLPRVHEIIARFVEGVSVGFHYSQLTHGRLSAQVCLIS